MRNLDRDLRDHVTTSNQEKRALDNKIEHALRGGNGEGPGIYERFRNIFDWREEHITSHNHAGQERRSSATDWRKFWMGVADRTFTVLFAVVGIVIVYIITGHVVSFP